MALLISEELLLLTYRPEDVKPGKGIKLDTALGGGLVGELVLDGYAELVDNKVAATKGHDAPSSPELARALKKLGTKPRRPDVFVARLTDRIRPRLLTGLADTAVLRRDKHRILGVYPTRRYPIADAATRDEVTTRLRAAVIDGQNPDPRTATLACLVHQAGLSARIFPGEDQRTIRLRLKELDQGTWTSDMVHKAIQAAITAKIISTAITTAIYITTTWPNN